MTYPSVVGFNTSFEPANETSHTVNMPANIVSGELLLVFFATDGDNVSTFPGDWTKLFNVNNGTASHLSCAYKVGSEGATITVTTSSSEYSAHISFRISGHGSSTNAPEASTGATNTNANPDPDSLTASWGADDNLWVAMEGHDDNDAVSSYPANYADNQHTLEAGNQGPTVSVATRDYNTTDTQDPGTFTIAAAEEWVAGTVVVFPGSEPAPYTPQIMFTLL